MHGSTKVLSAGPGMEQSPVDSPAHRCPTGQPADKEAALRNGLANGDAKQMDGKEMSPSKA